jgi:hypothetical protein
MHAPRARARIIRALASRRVQITEIRPEETENPLGGYGKTVSHVVVGLKTTKGTKQLKLDPSIYESLTKEKCAVGDVIYIEVRGVSGTRACGAGDAGLVCAWCVCRVCVCILSACVRVYACFVCVYSCVHLFE